MDRFWSKTNKNTISGCWEWIACRGRYGKFKYNGKDILAHRMAWILTNGDIPFGMCICHKCDNRLCVNPDHLFLGTNADNSKDMVRKNRQAKGSKQGLAKLNESLVREIRNKRSSGVSYRDLSLEYNVHEGTLNYILNNRSWKHV